MSSATYTCIVCPVSCRIAVAETDDGTLDISGHTCKRGLDFAQNEHSNPMRMLTTTVKLNSSRLRRLPVIGSAEIPKSQLRAALDDLRTLEVTAPVRMGDVIAGDIRGTGVDILAARSVD